MAPLRANGEGIAMFSSEAALENDVVEGTSRALTAVTFGAIGPSERDDDDVCR
jgi:hypothetical protein